MNTNTNTTTTTTSTRTYKVPANPHAEIRKTHEPRHRHTRPWAVYVHGLSQPAACFDLLREATAYAASRAEDDALIAEVRKQREEQAKHEAQAKDRRRRGIFFSFPKKREARHDVLAAARISVRTTLGWSDETGRRTWQVHLDRVHVDTLVETECGRLLSEGEYETDPGTRTKSVLCRTLEHGVMRVIQYWILAQVNAR